MRPIDFPGANANFRKPAEWDDKKDGECLTLPVNQVGPMLTSVWKPTDQERAQLAQGQNIALTCYGLQPPVYLAVADIQGKPLNFKNELTPVLEAAVDLLNDVRRRYPGEELRCPYMRALDEAVAPHVTAGPAPSAKEHPAG